MIDAAHHTPIEEAERLFGVDSDLVRTVRDALDEGRDDDAKAVVAPLHAADLAELIEQLSADQRAELVEIMRERFDPELLLFLDDSVRDSVLRQLGSAEIAAAVSQLDSDDAVDLIEDMHDRDQKRVLARLSPSDREILEQALTYPPDSAGRLMQREIVTVPEDWAVGDTIDYMRARAAQLPRDFYDIFTVDTARRPVGVIPLSRLMRTRRPVRVRDIANHEIRPIPVTLDQEEVALLFQHFGLVSAPVVDEEGRLVGVITVLDIVDVMEEEHGEDLMRLGGVQEDDFYKAVLQTTGSRFSWLLVNLLTAIAASVVISFFEATIADVVALAVLMPIVASMGGNSGTQTLTVAVRAIAMHQLTPSNAARVVGKEVMVGLVNGLIFAVLAGLIAWMWFANPAIGAIIASAMVINLLVAGLAGIAVPIVLDRTGVDPAIASTVILTTITDIVGFFTFLGLAALVLI